MGQKQRLSSAPPGARPRTFATESAMQGVEKDFPPPEDMSGKENTNSNMLSGVGAQSKMVRPETAGRPGGKINL